MTDPDPDATYPWLPSASVLAWLKVDPTDDVKVSLVEAARKGAANWIEDQRPDLVVVTTGDDDEEIHTFTPGGRVVMAGLLACRRLFGVGVAFQELGAGTLLVDAAEVKSYLGRNKNAPVG